MFYNLFNQTINQDYEETENSNKSSLQLEHGWA